jgi:hypothetical protein
MMVLTALGGNPTPSHSQPGADGGRIVSLRDFIEGRRRYLLDSTSRP